MNNLIVEPLTKEAFVNFGEVIEREGSDHFAINNGYTQRYNKLAIVETSAPDDEAIISIFHANKLNYPLRIEMLERHPKGSQAFIPMDRQKFLIVVAPAADQPEPSEMRAFISNGNQGVNYARGTWHHPILVLEDNSDFLIVDRSGAGSNCDEHFFTDSDIRVLDY